MSVKSTLSRFALEFCITPIEHIFFIALMTRISHAQAHFPDKQNYLKPDRAIADPNTFIFLSSWEPNYLTANNDQSRRPSLFSFLLREMDCWWFCLFQVCWHKEEIDLDFEDLHWVPRIVNPSTWNIISKLLILFLVRHSRNGPGGGEERVEPWSPEYGNSQLR